MCVCVCVCVCAPPQQGHNQTPHILHVGTTKHFTINQPLRRQVKPGQFDMVIGRAVTALPLCCVVLCYVVLCCVAFSLHDKSTATTAGETRPVRYGHRACRDGAARVFAVGCAHDSSGQCRVACQRCAVLQRSEALCFWFGQNNQAADQVEQRVCKHATLCLVSTQCEPHMWRQVPAGLRNLRDLLVNQAACTISTTSSNTRTSKENFW